MENASKVRKADGDSQSAGWIVCPCNNCSDNLEFDSEHAGETVTCPHCGMDTVLFIPVVPVGSLPNEPELAPKPQTKRAKIVAQEQKRTTYKGGLEERLEHTGGGFQVFGILGLIAALLLLVDREFTWAAACCGFAVVAFMQGAVVITMCKLGAEIIRLLKKSNGLKYSGEISQPTDQLDEVVSYECSACGAPVPMFRPHIKCVVCGAEFEPGLAKEKTSPP
jgi:DNA-directed RNA polymerase subunit RPC12/RpoP